MGATPIGCQVRDAGTWKRIQKCHVKVAGVWEECQKIYAHNGAAWRTVWADDAAALGDIAFSAIKFDPISPYETGGGWKALSSGDRRTFETPPDSLGAYSDDGKWLDYDLNRTYQVRFTIEEGSFDINPTTGSWLSTAGTRTIESQRTAPGIEVGRMLVEYRRNEGTPTAVLKSGDVFIDLENGAF